MNYKIQQQIPFVAEKELEYLQEVIKNKWITEGPFTKRFAKNLQEFTGAKHVLLTNNGTLALFLCLQSLGIKEGDEVIVPNFTFNASASSVVYSGAKPVFVDVNGDNYNIDVEKIERLITNNTKAIMPVHIYGQSADLDPIVDISRKYGIPIIEDAAQGFGVFYKNKHVGTIGEIGMISFFADKTITMGEGAVILTNNTELYEKLKYIRNQGRLNSGTFIHSELGMNFRVTDLQSAVGVAQMEKYDEIKAIKLGNYNYYKSRLKDIEEIEFMQEVGYSNLIPFRVAIRTKAKVELTAYMEGKGIETRGYFYPLHRQPCYLNLNYSVNEFPVTNSLFNEGICLPVHCYLKKEQLKYICDTIIEYFN
jgi:perosamine synthetase